MEKVIPVKITTDKINCFATISRSCISAITACARLNNMEKADEMKKIKHWADEQYDYLISKHIRETNAASK